MIEPALRVALAERDVAAARARLAKTAAQLQVRLEPRRLAVEARAGLTDARDAAVGRAQAAARRRPGALAGVVALAGLFLARRRIAAMLRRRRPTYETSDGIAS